MEKPTAEGVSRLANRIGTLRQRLARIEKIARLKDYEEWQSLKPLLDDMRSMHGKAVEYLVENGEEVDDHEFVKKLRIHQSARDSFKWLMDLIEKPKDEADKLKVNISELESILVEKQSEMEQFGLNKQEA